MTKSEFDHPRYYIVGIRPVKLEPTPGGGLRMLAFDWKTGEFIRTYQYLAEIMHGKHDEVDEVSEDEFDRRVEALRAELGGC